MADPYSMSMEQWDVHMEMLLDMVTQKPLPLTTPPSTTSYDSNVQCGKVASSDSSGAQRSGKRRRTQPCEHPQYIEHRTCHNRDCGGREADFIVDANGGSVVCILCGMIQDTAVLDGAPTFANSDSTSSVHVVHRYSRIAYVRGLLKSSEGETKLVLTETENRAILHYITNHTSGSGGGPQELAHKIKRAVTKMRLRTCLVYHAHTIAYSLFKSCLPARNETQIRIALQRFRSLENEWDRAPRNGTLRKGTKKFPSIPWMWKRICRDMNLLDIECIFYVPRSQKHCISKRESQYNALMELAGHKACAKHVS